MNQTTIRQTCALTNGVGLHSGKKSSLFFHPAPAHHGIVFLRSDLKTRIPATYRYAVPSPLCTTLENDGARVSTVEHLLSVCNGMGIDNLLIEVDTEEIPILDGSGAGFFKVLKAAGIRELDHPKHMIRVLDTIVYQQGDITIYVTPSNEINFTFSIDFNHRQIGIQEATFHFSEQRYAEEIVGAKTFGFIKDYERHRRKGLIKGGNRRNAIILNEEGDFDNPEVMTWLNEPNLHKILDQIGDLYLADNLRIVGNIYSHKSGHSSHLAFVRHMMTNCTGRFEIIPAV
jgi:UDP-3-O-[3-hydroxymyristoyl] N-acetylglucosamine deacetylase